MESNTVLAFPSLLQNSKLWPRAAHLHSTVQLNIAFIECDGTKSLNYETAKGGIYASQIVGALPYSMAFGSLYMAQLALTQILLVLLLPCKQPCMSLVRVYFIWVSTALPPHCGPCNISTVYIPPRWTIPAAN